MNELPDLPLVASYIDDVDESIEFELIEDEKGPLMNLNESLFSFDQIALNLPAVDISQDALTWFKEDPDRLSSTCYSEMETIFMLITSKGVCEHSFCEPCVLGFQDRSGIEPFNCPICGETVTRACINEFAMKLASKIREQSTTKLKEENENLQIMLEQQQRAHGELLQKLAQQSEDLMSRLNKERDQNMELQEQIESIEKTHHQYKVENENMLKSLQTRITQTKAKTQQQLTDLEKEKNNLLSMKKQDNETSQQAAAHLQTKIAQMTTKLDNNRAIQKNLELLCIKTENELDTREKEAEAMRTRLQTKLFQEKDKIPPSATIMGSVVGLLWNSSSDDQEKLHRCFILQENDFELKEIRGNRKDGRVRRARMKEADGRMEGSVALKKICFDGSVLTDQSVLGTLGSYWYSKTEQQIQEERVLRLEEQIATFREAMLLYKLHSDHIISLQGLVQTPNVNEFYLQLPFIEYDLSYLIEVQSHKFGESEIRSILHQLLLGLFYLHSADIVHRQVNPATILSTEGRHIILGGLSHAISLRSPTPFPVIPIQHIDCVAPELLFMNAEQQTVGTWKAIDMWAVGCILALLLRKESLFLGSTKQLVLESILCITEIAPPEHSDIVDRFYSLASAFSSVKKKNKTSHSMSSLLPRDLPPEALDLCLKLLCFNPNHRLTAKEALNHPYFLPLSSRITPSCCSVGFDCSDSEIPAFVASHCSAIFS